MLKFKVIISVLTILCLRQTVISQDTASKFSFELFYSGGLSGRQFDGNSDYQTSNSDFDPQKSADLLKINEECGYSTLLGCLIERTTQGKISVHSGILFQSYSRQKEYNTFSNIIDPRNPPTNSTSSNLVRFEVKDSDRYICIPLGIGLRIFSTNKAILLIRTGARWDYYHDSKRRTYAVYVEGIEMEVETKQEENYRKLGLSSYAGPCFQWRFKQSLCLTSSIMGNFQLTSGYQSEEPYIQRWFGVCLAVGLKYSIR